MPIRDEEIEEFLSGLSDHMKTDVIPKIKSSAFCISILDGHFDLKLAIEVGASLLLDKPLLIIAIGKDIWISPRLRQIADLVIEGEKLDDSMKAKVKAFVEDMMRQRRTQH